MVKKKFQFLSPDEESLVIQYISEAEKMTSGEIRLHVELHCKHDPLERATKVFQKLRMDRTKENNGILIYVAYQDRKIAIWGGKGIHEKVGDQFWTEEINILQKYFADNQKIVGLQIVINQIGEKLKEHFPWQKDDVNELSNEISYGDHTKESL